MKPYDKGYLDGQLGEAKVNLANLQALKGELESVGFDSERSFINKLMADIEEFLNNQC